MIAVDEKPGLSEREKVGDWREMQLLDLGFAPQEAELIARKLPDHRSYQEFERLIRRGCSTETAMRILL